MIYTGTHKPEKSRRTDYSLDSHDEGYIYVRRRRRAVKDQDASKDHHTSAPAGDGVRLLHRRLHQAKQLLSVVTGLVVFTTDLCI